MATFKANFSEEKKMKATFSESSGMSAKFGSSQVIETGDYEALSNKPKINGVTLIGDRSFEDLGEESLTNMEIISIFNRVFGGE